MNTDDQLRQTDPAQYWRLRERDVDELGAELLAGAQAAEPAFLNAFTQLADHLLLDDPAGLARLIAQVRDLPLSAPRSRQQRRFYEGLVLGQSDRYAEALAVFDALLAEPDLDVQVRGRALNTRANYCRYTGRLEEALAGYRASLDLWERLGNRLRAGIALLNLGITRYDLHDYDEAQSSLMQAVRCFEAASGDAAAASWLAAAHNELGLVCRDLGQWSEALMHLRSAEAHYQAEQAHDPLSRVRNNIGEVLLFQGQVNESAAAFQQALSGMHTQTYAVDAHLNLGLARQVSGDLPGALSAFHNALSLAEQIDRQDILAHVHYRLGDALRRSGQDEQALAQFTAAAGVIERTRAPLHHEELKISLMGRWQQVYEMLVLHCLALHRPTEAFAWAERARARAFADAVAVPANGEEPSPHSPVAVATAAELQAALPVGVEVLCYFTTGVLEQDQPLLGKLPPGPLREHLVTPARTLLFAITREGLAAHTCPLDPNTFTSTSPRKEDANPTRFLAPPVLRRLHDWLLAPAMQEAAGPSVTEARRPDIQRLYIIPHGPIHHVPFGALTDARGHPLVRQGGPVLAYAPSATVLLRLLERREADLAAPSQPELLAVGYDGLEGETLLRHTEAEARYVARITGGQAWVGGQPKLTPLSKASRHCRRLHFACHGRFDYDSPLQSYLATGEGERLSARQVLENWQLPGTLVVLSACQTGVSRVLRGDEPIGLVRAFLYAGARAVLVSQWAVDDLSTFLLMRRFYELLPMLPDPAAALQAAQVWLRDLPPSQVHELMEGLASGGMPVSAAPTPPASVNPFASPRFWAAFTLVGGM